MHIRRAALCWLALPLFLAAGCGGGDDSASDDDSSSSSATDAPQQEDDDEGEPVAQPGAFTAGTATVTTPAGSATMDLSEGLYVEMNDTVVANFADGVMNDPATNALQVSGSPEELTITILGPLQRQMVTTECTVDATEVDPAGLQGTYECEGDVTGTFEAQ